MVFDLIRGYYDNFFSLQIYGDIRVEINLILLIFILLVKIFFLGKSWIDVGGFVLS